jgi:Tol biopolymer transport system component/DNA-binding winged helix-turn-helix (wHTH) protein
MMNSNQRRVRFGPYEVDLVTGEVWRNGTTVRLEGQPFQILKLLLERPGELITREELRSALWDSDTFVDFEHGVNTAVRKLRQVLRDGAEKPRYIQTIHRRGYRFIGELSRPADAQSSAAPVSALSAPNELRPTENPRLWPKVAAWTALGVVLILAALIIFQRTRVHQELPAVRIVPFTTYPGYEFCPAFSPDGSRIAFAWNGDSALGYKDFDLYVKVKRSENLLRLTNHPSVGLCATWSPDGTEIAFIRFPDSPDGSASLRLMPALGGSDKELLSMTYGAGVSMPPVWSPDGKWIVIGASLHEKDPHSLYFVSVESGDVKEIPHAAGCPNEHWAAFSHSGNQWSFICQITENEEYGIYRGQLSDGFPSGTATLVTRFPSKGRPGGLAWTADDERLLLSRKPPEAGYELDEVAVTGGSLHKLPFGQGAEQIAISAHGDELAFVARAYHLGIWRKDLLNPRVSAVNLLRSSQRQDDAQYSPDKKHIAFTSSRDGVAEIWMSDADGTNLAKLSDANSPDDGWPRWSSDSQKIVFSSNHSGHWELYVVDIAERLPHKLACSIQAGLVASWSHDGAWIYFQGESDEKVYRCPATGGEAVPLSTARGLNPWESSDGKTLYFADQLNTSLLKMLPLQPQGVESAVQGMPAVSDAGSWSVAPRGIYFIPADAPKSVRFFDFATRQVRPVFDLPSSAGDLAVSKDARWITYTQADEGNADIMLVENLR